MDAANQLSDIPNDLISCEKEPLQFIGSIQSIGALLAFTVDDRRIQAASENIETYLQFPHRDVISAKLEHVVGQAATDRALSLIRELSISRNRANFLFEREGHLFDAAVFVTDGLAFFEFEPHLETEDYSDILNTALVDMRAEKSLKTLSGHVCRAVQRITGVDRVMMYRFLAPHDHGEVIAEHRVLSAHSYFQQRFPASDIPKIARDLYLRNQVRQIPDVDLPISKVSPSKNPATGKDINLSDSRLRAVSPIHLEYLRNMKVRCSFSVAVIVDRKLWALIACHHSTEKLIPSAQRSACELVANAFAGQARLVEDNELAEKKMEFLTKLSRIFEETLTSHASAGELLRRHQSIFDTFGATGVAVVRGSQVDFAGLCPPRADLTRYAAKFIEVMDAKQVDLIASESLHEDFPMLPQFPRLASGALAVRINDDSVAFLFRPEITETIVWGGDPRKQLERKEFGGRINPRTSFEAWEETISNHSSPWFDYEIEGFQRLKELIFVKLGVS